MLEVKRHRKKTHQHAQAPRKPKKNKTATGKPHVLLFLAVAVAGR
jgi:hypothetical protein